MQASTLQAYRGRVVELTFMDGARIKARIISVDPEQLDNHVIYDVLEVRTPGPNPDIWMRTPLASGAQRIADVQPAEQ
jgi:hypothetical protein